MIFKHFAFTIYSGLPLKLSNSFVSQDWKMEPLCFVQWNLFDFQFNLQIANAATKRLSVPLCMVKPQFCSIFVYRNRALLIYSSFAFLLFNFYTIIGPLFGLHLLKTTSSAIRMPFFYKENIGGVVERGGGASPHWGIQNPLSSSLGAPLLLLIAVCLDESMYFRDPKKLFGWRGQYSFASASNCFYHQSFSVRIMFVALFHQQL